MAGLFERIRAAVIAERYIIGVHAAERLDEREIPDWQVVEGIATGLTICERPADWPNPIVEVEQLLPDGTRVKAVWAWVAYHQVAKLVTVHYFDE